VYYKQLPLKKNYTSVIRYFNSATSALPVVVKTYNTGAIMLFKKINGMKKYCLYLLILLVGLFNSNNAFSQTTTIVYSGAITSYTVPAGVTSVIIECWGAQGGASGANAGGLGVYIKGTFTVTSGQVLRVLVGGAGTAGTQGGGGGGSFVTTSANAAMCIAGGGGGGYYSTSSSGSGQSAGTTSTTAQNGMSGNSGAQCGTGGAGPNGGGICATNGVN